MNWDAIAAAAELVAAVSVILSVLYLASQVKQSATSTRAAAASNIMMSVDTFASNMYMDPKVGQLFFTGMSTPEQLNEADWLRFSFMLVQLLQGNQVMYLQHKDGVVADEYWESAQLNLGKFCVMPGFLRFWNEQSETFTKGFQELIESLKQETHRN